MWSVGQLARIAAESLRNQAAQLDFEQAVRGLDALDELGLHPLLARGFERSGLGVHREQPFPGDVARRAKGSERERCDLVLTEDPDTRLIDPVAELKTRDRAVGTLFEPVADLVAPAGPVTGASDAFWMEVKAVAQHAYVEGVPAPNQGYASALVSGPGADVRKLAREEAIGFGAAMVVLFTDTERTARHDLTQMAHRLLDRNLPIGAPELESFPIEDRAGNASATVCLIPVRR